MGVLLFLAGPGGEGPELHSALSRLVPAGRLEMVHGWQAFSESLLRLDEPGAVVIIWNPSHDDLRRAAEARELLRRGRTILALPDQDEGTVLLAHRLLPAFITYIGDGTTELLSVVSKLTGTGSERPGL
jgi:hypothetical protein